MTSEKPGVRTGLLASGAIRRRKALLIRSYQEIVGADGARRAKANHHSKRRPIQCGLTIHAGNDCSYSCTYCYILDMGFKFGRPTPSGLSAEELVLSLLYNPNFVPGRHGTYAAIGSIVEPFQPELKSLTMRYITELAKLGNPIQFSTKSHLSSVEAKSMSASCGWVSPLVTIITLDESKARLLEPLAPSPEERLETISNLSDAGLKPFLFLRPVIPGIVTVDESTDLIKEAIRHGSSGVVLGNFRVTRRILQALKSKHFDVSEILKRVGTVDMKQRTVSLSDIQNRIEKRILNLTTVYRRSCCASAYCAELEKCSHVTVH